MPPPLPPPPTASSSSSVEPIQAAISDWTKTIEPPASSDRASWTHDLASQAPRRFTVYEPMALLPAGSFANALWTQELSRHDATTKSCLWTLILQRLSRPSMPLTHLAVNQGIPPGNENVIRRPSQLRILHGDFGPTTTSSSPPDFDRAFWVRTKQNGIWQTWAPRWTMFSRGNVKEKTRLLGFPSAHHHHHHHHHHDDDDDDDDDDDEEDDDVWAVDLYAGIGYFAFCYAKLGMRVACWELNPWSVEGLRRGAALNGWQVCVNPGPEKEEEEEEEDQQATKARLVVFCEDNALVGSRTDQLRRWGCLDALRHVNCGLLPTSRAVWERALCLTRSSVSSSSSSSAWLHLHENVAEADIETTRGEIERLLRDYEGQTRPARGLCVEKVEKVKTYAPGVWHCVFDVLVTSS